MTLKSELRTIPLHQLLQGAYQPRKRFSDAELQELAQSILNAGLLQPIVVRPHKLQSQHFEIIAGERRWRAAQLAGLEAIPCLINQFTDEQAAEAATVENINRVNLNPLEEAQAYQRMIDEFGYLHGLLGFDLVGKTVGVIGTGNIGMVFAQIMLGFGCKVLAYDIEPNPACEAMNVDYVPLEVLLQQSHIISLHCPLTPDTHHLINDSAIEKMHEGTLLINTSRGAVVDTSAVIEGLKNGRLGGVGLDVYEEEGCLFFKDLSDTIIQDDTFARLQTFPNVLITGHQAFFTKEALSNIARITLENIDNFGNS